MKSECIVGQWLIPGLLSKDPIIIDCGFKYGEFAIPFLKKYGGKAICLEPTSESVDIFLKSENSNIGLNIDLYTAALWLNNEKLTFYVLEKQMSSNSVFKRKPSKINKGKVFNRVVNTMTLEDCIKKCNGKPIDLLKVDIEGAEWEVFFNMPRTWLEPIQQISIELHTEFSGGKSVNNIISLLQKNGFKINKDTSARNKKRLVIYGAKK